MAALNRRELSLALLLAPVTGAFAQSAPQPLPVVATFSILADLVQQVGGPRVAVTSLVAPGGDAHVYSPTPGDARMLSAARAVVVNGLGFEGWMSRLVRSSGTQAPVITATTGVTTLKEEARQAHGHSHGHSHGGPDPHAWQSVANVKVYVRNIANGLAAADKAGEEDYRARAAVYTQTLDALEADVRAGIAGIPRERRKVIVSHGAFLYFEKAYGIGFISPRGVSTSAEPSPQAVARLIQQIRREKVPAVFLESITDQRLMRRIAEESGARIGGTLYSDALTPPGGPASTYVDLMRHNLRQLVTALSPTA
jgi:zinc/manganese transport system substrate-binding protein